MDNKNGGNDGDENNDKSNRNEDQRNGKNPEIAPASSRSDIEKLALEQAILRKIARSRSHLMVCFLTLPVYMYAVYVLIARGHEVISLMIIYMAIYSVFGVLMASKRCPQCGKQFFVKVVLLNLLTSRCVHCRRSYKVSTS